MQDDVAHRDEALLQDAGDSHHSHLAQHVPGEQHDLVLGFEGADAAEHHHHGQHTADALAQEGGPGHTGHAHLEAGHEQNVHADVGQGRDGQEVEGGLAVAQRGEDAGGDVVEEHEGQAQHVDIQIQRRICKDLLRGVDELQQAVAAHKADQKIYNGTDELTEKARKEMPVSDFETTDIQYAGMSVADNKALAWFISGNEYQAHYYLPMEVEVKGDDKYSFVRTYKPMNGETDNIAILNWNGGYSFIVNNSDCASVKITGENGIYEEKVKEVPYVFYYPSIPSQYVFLDSDGNELS